MRIKGLFFIFLWMGLLDYRLVGASVKSKTTPCAPATFYEQTQKNQNALKSIVFDYKSQKWFVALQCGDSKNKMMGLDFEHLTQAQNFYRLLKQKKVYGKFVGGQLSKVFIK